MTETEIRLPVSETYLYLNPPDSYPPIYPGGKEPEKPPEPPVPPQSLVAYPLAPPDEETQKKPKVELKPPGRFERILQRIETYIPAFEGFEYEPEEDTGHISAAGFLELPSTAPPMPKGASYDGGQTYKSSARSVPVSVGLYQRIASHCKVDELLKDKVEFADFEIAEVKLRDFRKAGYSLAEIHQLVPQYEFFCKLDMDKALFGQKWDVRELAELYKQPLGHVCYALKFTAQDFLRCKFSLPEMKAIGLNMTQLIDLGADFAFLMDLHAIPFQVQSALSPTRADLHRLKLTLQQREQLSQERQWTPMTMVGKWGITAQSLDRDWIPFDLEPKPQQPQRRRK